MEQQRPILIYYNTRGNCQVIRTLLLYIEVEFDEISVDCKGNIPYELRDLGYQFTNKGIPYLIHNGIVLNQIFPILKYICVRFGHPQLLGQSLEDSIRIAEIIVRFMREKSKMFICLFGTIKQFLNKCPQSFNKLIEIKKLVLQCLKQSKYYEACLKLYVNSNSFLCGYPTILDFIFYESCFYCANLFAEFTHEVAVPTLYKKFFEKTPFYQKNRQKLQSYKVFLPQFDAETNQIFRKLWVGDQKYFNHCSKSH